MRAGDVFPSKYLKAADLGRQRPVVTIERVEFVSMQGTQKPVAYFVGKEKGLTLNRTNWSAIEAITGKPDSDDWPGHRIRLYATKVPFQGQTVEAIRVDAIDPVQETPAVPPAPVRPGPAVERAFPLVQPAADDIPF